MKIFACDKSQFDVLGGNLACTGIALMWGRYCLEKVPETADLDKMLYAGTELYRKWKRVSETDNAMPCWKELVSVYPMMFDGIRVVYETNGRIQEIDDREKEWLMVTLNKAMKHLVTNRPRSILLTVGSSSYGISCNGQHLYFFDSHGSGRTDGNAYMLEMAHEHDLKTFLASNFLTNSDFTMIVYEKT